MKNDLPKIVIILGPTACGKSDLAYRLANSFKFEIINADSLQVYKYLDIGTAKPSEQILNSIPHHLIDIVRPDEELNAGLFKRHAEHAIENILKKNKKILIVGGTYLYVKVLTEGLIEGIEPDKIFRNNLRKQRDAYGTEYIYNKLKNIDPVSALQIDKNDYVRTERALEVYHITGSKMSELQREHGFCEKKYDVYKIGIDIERDVLKKIIQDRLNDMLEKGFIEEVRSIRNMGYDNSLKPLQSIGYKEIIDYLDGHISLDEAKEKIVINTARLAKRQMTWLRRDKEINWYKFPQDINNIMDDINRFYDS